MPDGNPMPGGYWAGGQAYILNSKDSLDYLKRNWKESGELPVRAVYCDTTTAIQFYESYEPGNEQTRSQDEAGKLALLEFYKELWYLRGESIGLVPSPLAFTCGLTGKIS
tara:strand:- start:7 stop:336 length:330 start_codon:yes stop_codon:yes gene_type:complete